MQRSLPRVRLRLSSQVEARQLLYDHLEETDYEFFDDHVDLLQHSLIFVAKADDRAAGFFWLYGLEEDEDTWAIHCSVVEEFKRQFFSRTLMNTLYLTCYSLGCNAILAESENSDLLGRMGGEETPDGVIVRLPFIWR